jgi:UDP-N-acetylmuramoyl-L-alanyl-D-glutamate--2,6-diaminopimelate ligase
MMSALHAPTVRKLSGLLAGLAHVSDEQDRDIFGLSMDSRHARAGDLFFACVGQQAHGLHYLKDALRAGVAAVVWEPSPEHTELPPAGGGETGVPAFAIEKLGSRIGVIADRFYGHPSRDLCVIGITGTDGKTSCSQFLASALHREQVPCGVIGTLGYGLYGNLAPATHTTPDAIRLHGLLAEMRTAGARYVIMEVSSHGLEQGRVNGVDFDTAVLTNLTRDHLDYHGDQAAYANAKRRLFQAPGLRSAVLNMNDPFGLQLLKELPPAVAAVGYGLDPVQEMSGVRQVRGSALQLSSDGFALHVSSPWGDGELYSRLLGRFNASNVLAVMSVLLLTGMPFDEARDQVQALRTVPGRMERFGGGTGQPLVVVDYAHTPDALRHVLTAVRGHCHGKLWCVFGCGGDRDRGKRPLMGAVAEQIADQLVVTDDNPRTEDPDAIVADILSGLGGPDSARVERDRAKAIEFAVREARAGDVVLVAGKGHEDFQLVGERRLPFSDREQVRQLLAETRP